MWAMSVGTIEAPPSGHFCNRVQKWRLVTLIVKKLRYDTLNNLRTERRNERNESYLRETTLATLKTAPNAANLLAESKIAMCGDPLQTTATKRKRKKYEIKRKKEN